MPRANAIDPNLKDPKNDEIMFAFQRELANNWSFNIDWIQRWFRDATADQNCYGLPCNTVAATVYAPSRIVTDFGPDNLANTGDDRRVTLYDVKPEFVGKDAFFHTNCGNNVSVDCVQRYKAIELSIGKRMSNRWQMQGSYVWSRLDGDQQGISTNTTTVRAFYDYTNPNNLIDSVRTGRGLNDQPHAFKLLGSYRALWGITVGANYQAPQRPAARSEPHGGVGAGLARDSDGSPRYLPRRLPEPALAARRQARHDSRQPAHQLHRRSAQRAQRERQPEHHRRADAGVHEPGRV